MFDFAGARVLVVGGGSGIGMAVAEAAASAGAGVTVAGRTQAKLDAAVARFGGEARTIDITDDTSVEAFFAGAEPWDHVVVSAAAFRTGPVREQSMAEAKAAMESKFWGSYRVARSAPIAPEGSLTLISGVAASRPTPARALLSAAAAAVEVLARGLALELAPVRVNCVSPGLVDTPMLRAIPAEVLADMAERMTVTGRIGAADEIALQVLACMANRFMTGTVIAVDGGRLLR